MRRDLGDGFELDDDPDRVDLDAIVDFLANHAYWSIGRSRETIERLARVSQRVVSLFHDGAQIGYCRAVTDGVSIVYLADVYVLPEYRGRGLGVELVREMIERGPYERLKWILHTEDAHDLYRKFGFAEPGYKVLERLPPPA